MDLGGDALALLLLGLGGFLEFEDGVDGSLGRGVEAVLLVIARWYVLVFVVVATGVYLG